MNGDAWVKLDWRTGKVLWAKFADRYQFRAGIGPDKWPAIVEPTPSVVWDLGPVFTGDYGGEFPADDRDVAALVLGTLQDCTELPETVVFHDWVQPSRLFRPHAVDQPEGGARLGYRRFVPRWRLHDLRQPRLHVRHPRPPVGAKPVRLR